jgi:protein-S-isoprenylcysteine O-methyltransferase Ste14
MRIDEPDDHLHDHPGVIAPPPLIFGGALALTLLLDWLLGDPSLGLGYDWRMMIALVFIIAGFFLIAVAAVSFRNAKTHLEPWKPTTALVTTGIFAWSRNPIYVGMVLGYTGLSFLADSVLSIAALPLVIAVIHYGVIRREEHYLDVKFGQHYRDYRAKVRRWI